MKFILLLFFYIKDTKITKEEIEESDSSDPSTYNSSTTSTHSTSYSPTQRVLPSNQLARQGVFANEECVKAQETELINHVKKLLWLVIIFGENISATVGAIVNRNVTSLVVRSRDKECLDITFSLQVGSIPVPEFLRQFQLITASPARPLLLPFLQSNVHRIRQEVNRWEDLLSSC